MTFDHVVGLINIVALLLVIVYLLVLLGVLGRCRKRNPWGTPCGASAPFWRFRCDDHVRRRR